MSEYSELVDGRRFRMPLVALVALLAVSCGGESEPTARDVPAGANYSASTLATGSALNGLDVAPDGDVYVVTDSVEVYRNGSGDPETIAANVGHAFGFAASARKAVVGNFSVLEAVDLDNHSVHERPVANVRKIFALAKDSDGNFYAAGSATPNWRLLRFDPDLSTVVDVPFPGLEETSSVAVGPDGLIYAINIFSDDVLVMRSGEQPTKLELNGIEGAQRIATTPTGDILIIRGDPGHISTSALPVKLLRFPKGQKTPVEVASYETNSYLLAGDDAGNLYYSRGAGDDAELVKLTPNT